jgi:two-component system NtrC family sensor kinase
MSLKKLFMVEKKYRYLWWHITLTNILFSTIPLFILAAALYYHFSISYTAKVMEGIQTLAANRQGALDLFLEERISQLTTLANTNSLDRLTDEDYLNKVFNIIQSRSLSYIDLGVIDQNGAHLAYVGPYYNIIKGVNYRNEKWFDATLNSGLYVSDVFLGFRKIPHFIIAVLVREKNRSWILRATIDSNIIESIVRAAQTGKTGDAYLINRENLLQTKPRFGGNLIERPPGPDFSSVVGARVEEISFKGEPNLFAAIPIKIKNWVLVIKEDPTEPLAPLLRAKDLVVLLSLLGLGLIIIGSVYTTKKMLGRLILSDREKAISDEVLIHESKMAALGKLAAGVAHEVNNPLTLIRESAGWIKDLLVDEDPERMIHLEEVEAAANKIEMHVDRAKAVTHRMLGFGRRMEPVQENVSLNLLTDQTVKFLESEALHRNIEIIKRLDESLPNTTTDTAQVQQVILNILDNAIDAVGENGTITVSTGRTPDGRDIFVAVSDTGTGIPKDKLDKIFDPFFTTKEVGKGTGLGLAICYGILEKLGGRIEVQSEEGKGSTFTVFLPVV